MRPLGRNKEPKLGSKRMHLSTFEALTAQDWIPESLSSLSLDTYRCIGAPKKVWPAGPLGLLSEQDLSNYCISVPSQLLLVAHIS